MAVKCLLPSWLQGSGGPVPGDMPPSSGLALLRGQQALTPGGGASAGSQHTSPPLPKVWRRIRELWLEQHLAAGGGVAKRFWPGCSWSRASRGVGHVALATSGSSIASTLHLPTIIPPGPRAKEPRGGGLGPGSGQVAGGKMPAPATAMSTQRLGVRVGSPCFTRSTPSFPHHSPLRWILL